MIQSKADYIEYLKRDRIALEVSNTTPLERLKNVFFPNPVWKFQRLMRKLEYNVNCKNKGIYKLYILYLRYRFRLISVKLNFSIPINIFGPGLSIAHYGTIIINSRARIGANCRMHACINIGASGGEIEAPIMGDNVYIAPGAKIFGNIKIPSNTAIGANAVVNKSFEEENTIIAGIPAKVLGKIDITKLIKHGQSK